MLARESCHSCAFATKRRITDFTIGDLWGVEKILHNINYSKGVSLVTINSKKGKEVFEKIKEKFEFYKVDYDIAASFNHYHNVKPHDKRSKFFKEIETGKINENNIIKYLEKYTKISIPKRLVRKSKRIIKRLLRR